MTQIEASQSDWEKCEPGSLVRYAAREQSRIRVRLIAKTVGVATACLIALFALTAFMQPIRNGLEPNYGGIVCSKVMSNSKFYLVGTLDEDTNSRIELHLKLCPKCFAWISQQKSSQANRAVRGSYRQNFVSTATKQTPE